MSRCAHRPTHIHAPVPAAMARVSAARPCTGRMLMRRRTIVPLSAFASAIALMTGCGAPPATATAPAASQSAPAGGVDRTDSSDSRTGNPVVHGGRRARRKAAGALRSQSAGRRAKRPHRDDRRHGFRDAERLRRTHPHAHGGPPREGRPAFQSVPHDGALLADTHGAALGPQSPHEQHGVDYRDGDRFSGNTGQRPNNVAPLAEMLRLNGYTRRASSARTTRRRPGK